ncbi:PaaI family thioesterase [Aneurinibacillus thermoaerophilus]|uniref:PaaI family thioesterase n=2 Tax=Aneurinibacillus thermoaerophilus TaxID=143495 RepID=UPI002E236E48|nr:PaaI family thioesterase [Aneurinibacillus thermoaerophilus]MED0764389.1 PaaI family thioesterase [Aneurinibacillus thermoaerophilus]
MMTKQEVIKAIEGLSERELKAIIQTLNALSIMKENRYPFLGNFLGVTEEKSEQPDEFVCSMPISRQILNPYRIVYGGITATLTDMAMGWMLEKRISDKDKFVTLEMNVRYHKAGTGKKLTATARVIHQAQDIWQMACHVHNDRGELIVTATGTFLQLRRNKD